MEHWSKGRELGYVLSYGAIAARAASSVGARLIYHQERRRLVLTG